LSVGGEDRWRIDGGDRAQDQAGGIETVGKHEVDRTENFDNDPIIANVGRQRSTSRLLRLGIVPARGLVLTAECACPRPPEGWGFSALRLLIDMMKDVEQHWRRAPPPEPAGWPR
jgi:hypothetical protein